jgi:hypothetical protein
MSFEVYLQCFGETERSGISRAAVRALFPIIEQESKPDYWSIRYDEMNSCHIGVTALPSEREMLNALYVARPCGDLRFWEGLLAVLRMGSVVIFWPGGPPVVADETVAANLPKEMTNAIGRPRTVHSAEKFFRLLQES